jgi:hypothetical protein
MSTYDQDYFKNCEAEPTLRALQILNNTVSKYNDDVLLEQLDGKLIKARVLDLNYNPRGCCIELSTIPIKPWRLLERHSFIITECHY